MKIWKRYLSALALLLVLSQASKSDAGTPPGSVLNDVHRPPVYGFYGPSYRWGWFGVNYRPYKIYHRGFYGHFHEYGYRRGY